MTNEEFRAKRRQPYIDLESYEATVAHIIKDTQESLDEIQRPNYLANDEARTTAWKMVSLQHWELFQLQYTGGVDLNVLADSLTEIVMAYEQYVQVYDKTENAEYYDPINFVDMIDKYVDYVNLLSAAICLHREDLIPRIHGLIEGISYESAYDGEDLVIEELVKFYLPDRPDIDEWFFDKQYRPLLEAVLAETPAERAKLMHKHLKNWYKSMKGAAFFWGSHEKIKPEFSAYVGYWEMCSAAFTYLHDINDSSYRDEIVYPKDLVDYARSKPRRTTDEAVELMRLRVEAGQKCLKDGYYFTPAAKDSRKKFKAGEVMPVVNPNYGVNIWQWDDKQS